jgi:hypothetical protein
MREHVVLMQAMGYRYNTQADGWTGSFRVADAQVRSPLHHEPKAPALIARKTLSRTSIILLPFQVQLSAESGDSIKNCAKFLRGAVASRVSPSFAAQLTKPGSSTSRHS